MRNYEKVIIGKNKATAGGGNLGLDHFIAFSESTEQMPIGGASSASDSGPTTGYIDENGTLYAIASYTDVLTNPYTYKFRGTIRDLKTDQGTVFVWPDTTDINNKPYPGGNFTNTNPNTGLKFTSEGASGDTNFYLNYFDPATNITSREVIYNDVADYIEKTVYDDRYLLLRGEYMEGQGTITYSLYGQLALIDLETNTLLWKKYYPKLNTVHVNYYCSTPTIGLGGETTNFAEIDFFTGEALFYGTLSGGADANSSSLYRPINQEYGLLQMYNADKFGSFLSYTHLFSKSAGSIVHTLDAASSYSTSSNEADPSIGVTFLPRALYTNQAVSTIIRLEGGSISSYLIKYGVQHLSFSNHRYFSDGVLLSGTVYIGDSGGNKQGFITAFLPYDIPTGNFGGFSISTSTLSSPSASASLNYNYTMQSTAITPTTPITPYTTTNGLQLSSVISNAAPRTEYNTV